MATIISSKFISKHAVDKYNFKVFAMGANEDSKSARTEPASAAEYSKEENPKRRDSDTDSNPQSQNSKDVLIESLMNKTDEMSSNFIKLQMKLESKEEEYAQQLKKVKEAAFLEGVEAGKHQAAQHRESGHIEGLAQFSSSVAKLENSAKEFESALEGIKGELIVAALDISKEVISAELSADSAKVAKVLSDELIKELQSASKVLLKVNPKDHGPLSEHVGSLRHVEVVSDSAVSPGGVIAISDAGNIDAQISKRFERVKRAALSE
jgi:flagellar assembly protein FliH